VILKATGSNPVIYQIYKINLKALNKILNILLYKT